MQPNRLIAPAIAALQQQFLCEVLPRVTRQAQVYFRHLRCRHRLADAVAEVVAICWKWFLRLIEQGKDLSGFVSTLAVYAAKHVRCGRRLFGQDAQGCSLVAR